MGQSSGGDFLFQHRQHARRAVGQRDPAQISTQGETQQAGPTAVFERVPVMRQRYPLAKRGGDGERPFLLDRIGVPGLGLVVKIHRGARCGETRCQPGRGLQIIRSHSPSQRLGVVFE